ncbi:hypothetical protein AC578_11142 [Pseudocercospora eumusae]|uniref:BTB domain-containing protein n=1 Tax=Pseudocercospora eumusae TaxID=321146 RepID=A0A139GVE7_9PEZI|nr:hypothetical protein AC578_11142 [Pseudocercospora eumusae]
MDEHFSFHAPLSSPPRIIPTVAPLEPRLETSEARADPFPWRLPSSPVGWHDRISSVQSDATRRGTMDWQFPIADELPDGWDNELKSPPKPREDAGYMSKDSPFSLDMFPPEMSFLAWFPKGNATITYLNDLGDMESISDLNPWIIEERSLLLAQAFEESNTGPQLHLEPLTPLSARPFLQYLYTGAYSLPTANGEPFRDVPTSLLVHCQLYRLADIYDLTELKTQANLNIIRQCEFACSSPDKPIDLCAAIEYMYKNMPESANVIDTLTNYCVTCFLSHGLADDFEFRRLAYDLRPFHQELCKVSMNRQFEDEDTAQAIIQMPFKPYVPDTYASSEDGFGRFTIQDVVYHFHGGDVFGCSPKKRDLPERAPAPSAAGLSLAFRSKNDYEVVQVKKEESPTVNKKRTVDPEAEADDLQSETASAAADRAFWEAATKPAPAVKEEASEDQNSIIAESEYEVIAGTAQVEALSSDNDSDPETLVVVDRPASTAYEESLPIRNRSVASSMTAVERQESSDSEWDIV